MANSDTLRKALARLKDGEALVRREIARLNTAASKARGDRAKHLEAASRSKVAGSARSHERSALAAEKKATAAEGKAAELSKKLGRNLAEQATKGASLTSAETSERKSEERETKKRRREELDHARQVAAVHRRQLSLVPLRVPKPERLRVIYLTANSRPVEYVEHFDDGTSIEGRQLLRVDREVREVRQMLRSALHRDLVHLEHLPAATLDDLVRGLNDISPHVVHFTGHGGPEGLEFDDAASEESEAHGVPFEWIAEALAATDFTPTLLVMNACESLAGAETLLPAVPIVVGMAGEIGDTASIVFASHFYRAIASEQSIGAALKQGRFAMKTALFADDSVLPSFRSREGVSIDEVVLIRVPEEAE